MEANTMTGSEGIAREAGTGLMAGTAAAAAGGTAGVVVGVVLGSLMGFLAGSLLGMALGERAGFWLARGGRRWPPAPSRGAAGLTPPGRRVPRERLAVVGRAR